MSQMYMTANFSIEEFLPPNHQPTDEQVSALRLLATELEIVRRVVGNKPIRITSGLRTATRNKAVGGSDTSHHLSGYAADFTVEAIPPHTVFNVIRAAGILVRYDQLIRYQSHNHLSVHPRLRQQAWGI